MGNLRTAISVDEALVRIAGGAMVLVVDSEDREDEGDLVMAAQHVTHEAVNFMIRQACGLVCLPCDGTRLDDLAIAPMVVDNSCVMQTAFTVSIDLRSGGSGISAHDRAATVRAVADPTVGGDAFSRPGHVFPLRARPGGVLERPGHTEAAVDLARMAGCYPAAMICEVLDDDGSPARRPRLERFALDHEIGVVAIDALITHRLSLGAALVTIG
jgi:3,4-dihydroxy 2-butanone 4-phosphate synthase / GTP cyclohydrolase II